MIVLALAVCGPLGAFAGYRLRLPAGVFMGALIGVGLALGIFGFPSLPVPDAAGWAVQILVGILVGLRMTRDALTNGVKAFVPAAFLAALFLVSSGVAALLAIWVTGVSPETAFFAAAPGGLTEMATIGVTQGANGPAVAAVHVSRLLLVIFAVGFLSSRLRTKNEPSAVETPEKSKDPGHTLKLAAISVAGVAGGVAGLALTPLPAGGVLGALLGAGAVRFATSGRVPEKRFQLTVQAVGGALIGLGLSAEFFETLLQLAGATFVINAVQMSVWLLAYFILVRLVGYDPQTATFASAPGGMGVTLSTVGDTDADLVTVAFTHLLRVSATIVTVPLVVAALTS